jgi:four helix bundle protein
MMHYNLDAYKSSMGLVKNIYDMTVSFPNTELWGLTSQMKKAAISIPANIAEGCARKTTKDMLHFFQIALGSITELKTHIEIACMLGFIKDDKTRDDCIAIAETTKKQLIALIKANEQKLHPK